MVSRQIDRANIALEDIASVPVGSVITDPVEVNGTLLCRAGTVVSEQLKKVLPKFNVTKVPISQGMGTGIRKEDLCLHSLNEATYSAIQSLDINKLIVCAETLVDTAVNNCDNNLLNVLLEYDEATFTHSTNVANFSVMLGVHLGLSIEDLRNLALGALLHDIGKIQVPLTILNKPDILTDEEMNIIRMHPYYGFDMLSSMSEINSPVRQIVYQHHENYDGTGYPRNLLGEHSYRLARIVHLCDVYEAMCAKRSYKKQMPRKVVRNILRDNSGKMFDPDILSKFLEFMPLYLVGETITQGTLVGVITDDTDRMNPTVYCHGMLFKVNNFENIGAATETMPYTLS